MERVELALRDAVKVALNDDLAGLPPHIVQRLDERIQRAVKKNAAFDIADFARLGAQLEYFDLRELQDTIVSKIAWPKFEGLFVNKEMLLKRFDQIAELRNAIRHSRSVDQITRKDGEAALIWFEQVLEKRRPAQSVLGMEHMRQ